MNLLSGRRTGAAFAALVVLMLALGTISYFSIRSLLAHQRAVEHTERVIGATYDLLGLLIDAQNGQRGFIITGDERFLEPFQRAVRNQPEQFRRLSGLTRDNRVQQMNLRHLERLADTRLAYLHESIAARRDGRHAQVIRSVSAGTGEAQTRELRSVIADILAEEHRLLALRRRTVSREAATVLSLLLVTTAFGAVLAALFGVSITREIRRRMAAEREAAHSRAALDDVIRVSPLPIVATDASHRVMIWNAAAERLFGWRADEVLFRPSPLAADEVLPDTAAARQQLLAEGFTSAAGVTHRSRDGETIEMEAWAALLHGGEGLDGASMVVLQDVRERRRTEQRLRESEARFRGAIAHSPIGIAVVGLDGSWQLVNPAMCNIVGYTEEELLRLTFQQITHPDDLATDLDHLRLLVAGEISSYQIEKRYLHEQGHEVWIQLIVSLVRDEAGQPDHLISQVQDISGRREAERERERLHAHLDAEHARLQAMMETLPVGVFITDVEGEILIANPAGRRIWGGEVRMVGVDGYAEYRAWRTDTGEPLLAHDWPLARALRSGIPVFDEELRIVAFDGTERIILASGLPIHDQAGRLVGGLAVNLDMTERKAAEEALFRAVETADRANRAKSDLLSRMSHELRTPLNSVIGFSGVIGRNPRGVLSPAELTYVERIRSNGMHLLSLINDVLDLSKIEAGRLTVVREPVCLRALIQLTLAELDGTRRSPDVVLVSEVPEGIAVLESDEGKLKQVLINLVGNASKFTETGTISVRVVADRSRAVRIEVQDTGIGIPEERMDAIFNAFEQAEENTARRFGGTGLGLAISRGLCQLLGYELGVTSTVGEGSTFTVHLAASAELAAA